MIKKQTQVEWGKPEAESKEGRIALSVRQWTKGMFKIGYWLATRDVSTKNGPNKIFTFMSAGEDGKPGKLFDLWNGSGLGPCMDKVSIGDLVKLTCLGETVNPKSGKTFVKFDIQYDIKGEFKLNEKEVAAALEFAEKDGAEKDWQ